MLRSEVETSRWLGFILLLGFAVRMYGLGQESLWLDEVVTAKRVHDTLPDLLYGWDSETQGPLYYMWVKMWGLIFGTGEVSLRFWSVVWGTLTIPLVYQLGRQLFSGTGAMLASLFFAVHPFAIYYSQEARPYALLLFLAVASYILLLNLMKQHRWPSAWGYILVTALAYYTHVFAVFLILSHIIIFYAFRRERQYRGASRYPRPYYLTFVLLLILCIPETVQNAAAMFDKMGGETMASWIPRPSVEDLLLAPVRYFMNAKVGLAAILLISVLAALRFYSEPRLRLGFFFLLILGVCFWLLPWIVSVTVTPVFVLRYTIPGMLVVIFLMATASASLQALPRQLFVIALLALTVYPLWNYYTKVDKDPWRQAGEYLSARVTTSDIVIPFPPFADQPLKHYMLPHLRPQIIRADSVGALEPLLENAKRIWVVESYASLKTAQNDMLPLLRSWGKEVRTVDVRAMQDINPTGYWICPLKVTLREQIEDSPEFGPTLPDSANT